MDRREILIDQAAGLIRKVGYAGFSYADLSDAVGIRKASIHHYFPSKSDLGVAVVESYRVIFARELNEVLQSEEECAKRLAFYAARYRTALDEGNGCLCGVLAAEFTALPWPVQSSVRAFFDDNTFWLESVMRDAARSKGENAEKSAYQRAHMILATLQGALLIARAQNDAGLFDATAKGLIAAVVD